MDTPVVDIVIPVYNEERTVAACVRRLHAHLVQTFPYPFRITVADNASTDSTWAVAQSLAASLPGVAAVHLPAKGRGRALKTVWLASSAPVLAYMDVDLSTDLDAFWPLVAPLLSGHSDLAIGTRLARSSRVVRGTQREAISRCYNRLLRVGLGARFSDAQCGFKAIRGDVAHEVLPWVEDTSWFFDTELLVLAERCGLRIHEVPVDWFDDPDSRVDVVRTARDDLAGMWRLRRSLGSGGLPTADIASRIGRLPPESGVGAQAVTFVLIGLLSGLLQLGLYAGLRGLSMAPQLANVVALVLATVVNTGANRRWTFGVRGPGGAGRQHLQGLAIVGVTLGLTSAALAGLHWLSPAAPTWTETFVVGLATVAATAGKFVVMRRFVFGSSRLEPATLDRTGCASAADTSAADAQSVGSSGALGTPVGS